MVGLCLLSKYYAVVLILTCLGASFAHPAWRQYYRSASPWIAVRRHHPVPAACRLGASVGCSTGAIRARPDRDRRAVDNRIHPQPPARGHVVPRRGGRDRPAVQPPRMEDVADREDPHAPRRAFLTALAFLPLAFTVLFGLCFELPIAPKMMIGMFPLAPLWLLQVVPAVNDRSAFRSAACVAVGTAAVALVASPAIAYYTFTWNRKDPDWLLPKQELAQEATGLWHRETHAPLRFVGGSSHFGNSPHSTAPTVRRVSCCSTSSRRRGSRRRRCGATDSSRSTCVATQTAYRLRRDWRTPIPDTRKCRSRTAFGVANVILFRPYYLLQRQTCCSRRHRNGRAEWRGQCEVRSDPRAKPKDVHGNLHEGCVTA